jgi:hypothetical protein
MALNFPANPAAQTPINTYGPTSTPEANTSNNLTYYFDGVTWGTVTTPLPFVSKSGDTMTGDLTVPSLNGGALAGLRNKIINGDMTIAQRGGQYISNGQTKFVVDRWSTSVINTNLVAAFNSSFELGVGAYGPVDSPTYLRISTYTAKVTPAVTDAYYVAQKIEQVNIKDFMWGSADAKPVTLSFRVRCSRAGTYSGSLRAGNGTVPYRSCVFTYTVTAADTWQDFSITLPGDPNLGRYDLGTEITVGVAVHFDLGSGNTYRTPTVGSWVSGNFVGAQGTTDIGTVLNETFYLTNVQLETGSIATPFERRPVGLEVSLCQRYYETGRSRLDAYQLAGAGVGMGITYAVPKRALPTVGFAGISAVNVSVYDFRAFTRSQIWQYCIAAASGALVWDGTWTADSEL